MEPGWSTMRGDGTSMSRRLFHSPDTIEFYSPDPQYRVRLWNESTNRGEEVCTETAKTSLIDVSVAYSIGKLYGFGAFRSAAEVFQAKIRFQHAVWMPSEEVDALFRFKEQAAWNTAALTNGQQPKGRVYEKEGTVFPERKLAGIHLSSVPAGG